MLCATVATGTDVGMHCSCWPLLVMGMAEMVVVLLELLLPLKLGLLLLLALELQLAAVISPCCAQLTLGKLRGRILFFASSRFLCLILFSPIRGPLAT